MTSADAEAAPATLVIRTTITAHRHKVTDETVKSAAVYPMDTAAAPGALQHDERRIPHHSPAQAQDNRCQRTHDQHIADHIGKGRARQKSADELVKTTGAAQRRR